MFKNSILQPHALWQNPLPWIYMNLGGDLFWAQTAHFAERWGVCISGLVYKTYIQILHGNQTSNIQVSAATHWDPLPTEMQVCLVSQPTVQEIKTEGHTRGLLAYCGLCTSAFVCAFADKLWHEYWHTLLCWQTLSQHSQRRHWKLSHRCASAHSQQHRWKAGWKWMAPAA